MITRPMEARTLHVVTDDEPNTTLVEQGPYRSIVGEHIERELVYLVVANATGNAGAFFEPAAALAIAAAMITAAGKAIEHQFRRQHGEALNDV